MIATFFTAVFSSTYWFGSWLNTATLITIATLGASIALQSGNMNLGGESQIYLGGFITAISFNYFLHPQSTQSSSFIILLIVICVLFIVLFVGALVPLLAAILKQWHNINEMITTFLFSAAIIPILNYAVTGPFRDSSQNLLATPEISDKVKLSHLLSVSDLNTSLYISIIVTILIAFILYKTRKGLQFRICGRAPEFAFAAGLNVKASSYTGMAISGALHAFTGFIAVIGTYYSCYQDFYVGLGWNALSAALIVHSNPLLAIPVSLLLAFIYTSSDAVMLTTGMSFNFEALIQGIILFIVSMHIVKRQVRIKT
ncbi:MAG: hypothetical protein BKP49_04025 [Treponema sp. CETP13]|nr:MAG: hypothetical protein BKP49_04025 [Treponema sp. CETP13]